MRTPTAALLAAILITAAAPATAETKLETEDQKTVYALGQLVAQQLAQFALTEGEMEVLVSGLTDATLGRDAKVPLDEYRAKIQTLAQSRAAAIAEKEKIEAGKFVTTMAKEKGAEKLPSGLVFIETTAGDGKQPRATDRVKVHYHGTLRDGTIFDSSVDRGQPASFGLNQVIPCWTEGVQKMKVGGKAKLICPSDIAYGDRGRPPTIPPGATLAFDIELLEVQK